ncbi:MAG TPA: hypothetical protein PKE52_02550 [Bacteroidales bacterium]|nr:hypothetical protein [Bacteroidales bacterium]
MKKEYDTGLGKSEIKLQVEVGTVAIAYTIVSLRKKGETFIDIKGDIPAFVLSHADELKGASLVISTQLDFAFLSEKERELAVSKLKIRYTLSGGFSATYSFGFDADDLVTSDNKKLATVSKAINLI